MHKLKVEYSKFTRYKHLVEETYLKEKLVFKRSLVLCKSLLKYCGVKDVNDQNVLDVCEQLIQPAIETGDPDLTILAIECIGLVTMLDKEVFVNYCGIYTSIL
jgi:hypothetical protein